MIEGDKVPAMQVGLSGGETVELGAPGGPLVIYFYPKDDTPGCTTEAKDFTALKPAFDALGARVVGVSRDPMSRHEKFISKYCLAVPLATDEGSLSETFGTWVEKQNYGRTYMGMERATFLIDADGTVARVWRKVKAKGHAAEVLAALKAHAKPA